MYERAAEFWIDLRKKLLYELSLHSEKPESSPLWCVYWADHQVNDLNFHLTYILIMSNDNILFICFMVVSFSVSLETCVCQQKCLL